MSVVGIGGFFFRSKDPKALGAWYAKHLGVALNDSWQWPQQAGPTVFMPFANDTDYFPKDKDYMLNFRVSDLDGLLATLMASGIAIIRKSEWDTPQTGRFARIHDPEGNPIELWQPPQDTTI